MSPALFSYHRRSFHLPEGGSTQAKCQVCGQPWADPVILPELTLLFGESQFKAMFISSMPEVSDKVFGLVFPVGALTAFSLLNVPGVYPALVLGVRYSSRQGETKHVPSRQTRKKNEWRELDETDVSVRNDSGVSREWAHILGMLAGQKAWVVPRGAYLCQISQVDITSGVLWVFTRHTMGSCTPCWVVRAPADILMWLANLQQPSG